MITMEYLIPFETKDGFCKDIAAFNSLISSNTYLSIKNKKITYKKINYSYSVSMSEVPEKNCSVFHVVFSTRQKTVKFEQMLKTFRGTVGINRKDKIQVLWNGISYEWAKELYPKIFLVENTMRKLFSKFMLSNLGIGWHKDATPKDVKASIKNDKYEPSHSILYNVDFIQLSNFLFKPYSLAPTKNLSKILDNLLKASKVTNAIKKDLEQHVTKNNWDRYFSNIVEYESEELKNKWSQLYKIRCKVAHNNDLSKNDYSLGLSLCKEICGVLNKALKKIDTVQIPNKVKESVSLRTIETVVPSSSKFVDYALTLSDMLPTGSSESLFGSIATSGNIQCISSFKDNNTGKFINVNPDVSSAFLDIAETRNSLLSGEFFSTASGATIMYPSNNSFDTLSSFLQSSGNDLSIGEYVTKLPQFSSEITSEDKNYLYSPTIPISDIKNFGASFENGLIRKRFADRDENVQQ